MLKEPSKIPEAIPESLAAIKNVQVGSRTVRRVIEIKHQAGKVFQENFRQAFEVRDF